MEFKMNRNGSGAYDGTAYKALMGAPKPGEVWMYRNGNIEREVLVINNHGTFCSILFLLDENKDNQSVQIVSRSLKWAKPHMLTYAFNQYFGEMVKKLPDADFDNVLDAIEDALDLNINRPDAEEVNDAVEVLEQQVKELEAQLAKVQLAKVQLAKAQEVCDSGYKEKHQKLVFDLIDRGLMGVVML